MERLIEDFKVSRSSLIRILKSLPKNRRGEQILGDWDLKDLVSHMSGWMIAATSNLKHLKRGETPPWIESIDVFNERNIRKRKSWNWDKVYKELVETSKEFIEECEGIQKGLWEKKYWPERSFTPKKILEIEVKHWRDTHLPQIEGLIRR